MISYGKEVLLNYSDGFADLANEIPNIIPITELLLSCSVITVIMYGRR